MDTPRLSQKLLELIGYDKINVENTYVYHDGSPEINGRYSAAYVADFEVEYRGLLFAIVLCRHMVDFYLID